MVVRGISPKLSVSGPSFARLFQLMEARGRDVGVGFNTVFLYQVEAEKTLSSFLEILGIYALPKSEEAYC